MTETLFFRLLETDDKESALHQAIQQLAENQLNANIFAVEPESFQQLPGATFAYWVSEEIRQLFTELSLLENEDRVIRVGDHPGDGFRYLRLFWGIPSGNAVQEWRSYQKGGAYSPFYYDIHLVANWDVSRQTYKGFFGRPGRSNERPSNYQYFFRPGLTYPRRSQKGLSIRAMPQGCIFADKGPAIFGATDNSSELLALLSIANGAAFRLLVALQMAFGSYEVGVLQRTPIPDLTPESITNLANLAHRAWSLKRSLDTVTQTSHAFILPALLQVNGTSIADRAQAWANHVAEIEAELTQIQAEIDSVTFKLYGIDERDRATLEHIEISPEATAADDEDNNAIADPLSLTQEMIAYALGVEIGRFDVRLATGARSAPPEPEPFDPLPVCSPGMLVGIDDLPPVSPAELPADYPISIPFNGILLDDEGHPNDLIIHLRHVLEIIWGDQSNDIEQEACQILGVRNLRDYFRNYSPSKTKSSFFAEHLSRYSKSRRQAPIYIPLSTRSGSYTLWLYYHRLTDQTL